MEEDQAGAAPALPATLLKKKHEEKHRKKDPRSWENITKATANLDEAAKLALIEQKYNDLYNDLRRTTISSQNVVKQCTVLQKEADHCQSELTKSIVARARLENLCRELQKQNKQIKEENIAKIKEEEERRKEVSVKFADKLADINNMMDENKEQSDKLRDENLKMTAKLADLYGQFQKREEDVAKMSHQIELERQFSQATLAKMELEIMAEKEMHAKEQALMKSNLEKSEANCRVLLDTVKNLQEHIDIYKTQYEDFETTMSKSNKVFDNFKSEMSLMTKQATSLEKESQSWRAKWQDSMKAVLELTEMKRNQDILIQSSDKKIEQLQKLCRQLQVDRASFLKLLKAHGIEPSAQGIKESSPEETGKREAAPKMTSKEKELVLLKDNLKAVQEALTKLSVDEAEVDKTDEAPSQYPVTDGVQTPPVTSRQENDVCLNYPDSDGEHLDLGNDNVTEVAKDSAVQ